MKRKAFISGPIQGVETNQRYRNIIRRICINCGFEVLDPWQREKILYRGTRHGWWNNVPVADFIKRDLDDIEKCDLLIAYLPRLSAGTCMELFYAKLKGKKTICVCSMRDVSPWVAFHCDVKLKSFKELKQALRNV
ncbi:MAG: nucleoside 2-deoxyribosyltransferase [Candidatus Bathyarchaeia archaeon]